MDAPAGDALEVRGEGAPMKVIFGRKWPTAKKYETFYFGCELEIPDDADEQAAYARIEAAVFKAKKAYWAAYESVGGEPEDFRTAKMALQAKQTEEWKAKQAMEDAKKQDPRKTRPEPIEKAETSPPTSEPTRQQEPEHPSFDESGSTLSDQSTLTDTAALAGPSTERGPVSISPSHKPAPQGGGPGTVTENQLEALHNLSARSSWSTKRVDEFLARMSVEQVEQLSEEDARILIGILHRGPEKA